MLGSGSFTVTLPDAPGLESIVQRIASCANVRADHASGRPWLLARISSSTPVALSHGPMAIAVIGHTTLSEPEITRFARPGTSLRDLAQLQTGHSGSYSVLGASGGSVYASAPAMQTRRIFHAELDGATLIADRADLLADLCSLPLDLTAVASRLARGLPHPADDMPMWEGISVVSGQDFIVAHPDAPVETGTWWSRPDAVLTREEGASLLREATADAVRVRSTGSRPIACDLSGGLDSTPLCYFASHLAGGVIARTFFTSDPGGREDLEWAERALPTMGDIREHVIFSTDGLPSFYEGLVEVDIPLDEPTQAGGAVPRIRHMLRDDRERGIDMHLTGLGGDHLLRGVPAWNHTLARTRPALAWSRARAEDVTSGMTPFATLRRLMDRRPYGRWVRDTTERAFTTGSGPSLPSSDDWSVPLSVPPWLSDDGREALHARLTRECERSGPLAPSLAGHFDLFTVRQAGRLARSMRLVGDSMDIAYESPLLDDRVAEAVFAVRYDERDTPLEWKPLMKAAMTGLLPEDYLRRTTKIGGAPQAVRGYAAHHAALRDMWEASGLLESGLVDRTALDALSRPSATSPPSSHIHALTDAAIFMHAQKRSSLIQREETR